MDNKLNQFKKIIIFFAGLLLVSLFTYGFSIVWYYYYNQYMVDPFWHNGSILLVGVYAIIYFLFCKAFGGFKLGYLTLNSLIGSQILATVCTDIITYIQVSLISRGRLSIKPMLLLMVSEIAVAILWSFGSFQLYTKIYPAETLLVVYKNHPLTNKLVETMCNRTDRYTICLSMDCDENTVEQIKEKMLEYDSVMLNEVPLDMKNEIIKFAFEHSIKIYMNPTISDIITRGAEDFHMFDTPLLVNTNSGLSFEQKFIKRLVDIVGSVLMLIILSPLMLIVALLIKLTDFGPVFYKQQRLTQGGKVFDVYKFRSMIVDAEKDGKPRLMTKNDSRVTWIGKFIRMLRIDELPQLLNILKGDMSFVGPRPERPELAKQIQKDMPEFALRLKVKAGLTGFAQVMGKYNTTPRDKLKLDLIYIQQYSIMTDFKILMMTIKIVFIPEASEGVSEQPTDSKKS